MSFFFEKRACVGISLDTSWAPTSWTSLGHQLGISWASNVRTSIKKSNGSEIQYISQTTGINFPKNKCRYLPIFYLDSEVPNYATFNLNACRHLLTYNYMCQASLIIWQRVIHNLQRGIRLAICLLGHQLSTSRTPVGHQLGISWASKHRRHQTLVMRSFGQGITHLTSLSEVGGF